MELCGSTGGGRAHCLAGSKLELLAASRVRDSVTVVPASSPHFGDGDPRPDRGRGFPEFTQQVSERKLRARLVPFSSGDMCPPCPSSPPRVLLASDQVPLLKACRVAWAGTAFAPLSSPWPEFAGKAGAAAPDWVPDREAEGSRGRWPWGKSYWHQRDLFLRPQVVAGHLSEARVFWRLVVLKEGDGF